MDLTKLLNAAALRVSPVVIAGETVYVKEPTGPQMTAYSKATDAGKMVEGTAGLFHDCIVNSDGSAAITYAEAEALVVGSTRISGKLLKAITGTLVEDAKNV